MQSKAATVEEYLAELPEDRRETIEAVRKVILKNLPAGCEEGMQYGMIGYFLPHSVYPPGYHCDPNEPLPFVHLASQKNYISLYLGCVYIDEESQEWFREAWSKTGKKLNMGKSCVRFKKLDDVPLPVVGRAIKRMPAKKYIKLYEAVTGGLSRKPAKKKSAKKKSATKKATPKKSRRKTTKKKSSR